MHLARLSTLLSLLLFSTVYARNSEAAAPAADTLTIQTASPEQPASASNSEDVAVKSTVFNGVEVPPMKELNGTTFDEDIKDGYCQRPNMADTLRVLLRMSTTSRIHPKLIVSQTSKPVPSTQQTTDIQTSLNTFHAYYKFHFASLDCIAFGSACSAHEVNAYPSFLLYKNGQFVKKFTGAKDLASLSGFVEETLESIRPGSRPKEGVRLPEVGAAKVDTEAKPDMPAAKDKDTAAGIAAGSKHNEQAAQVPKQNIAPAAAAGAIPLKASKALSKPSKPTTTPNPKGTSIPLTAESFQKLVTTTQDPWFVEFFVPWCHHCQALAPNWSEMSKEMQGKLNVGQVNCEVETRLCKDVHLRGYPTMLFFRGGERVEYDGLRGLGDLISYANKALDVGQGVRYVDAEAFKKMEETEEVIFVYFYDHATTSEDFAATERLTLSLIGHARLVKTDSAELAQRFKISTWPRLLVSRDGRPSYYSALAPKDMRDFRKVLKWMQSVWLPIVPELTASNSREIMDGRLVVLGILSRNREDELIISKREIKNAALEWMEKQSQQFHLQRQELRQSKQLRIEEAEDRNDQRALRAAKSIRINMDKTEQRDVGFAWVDGVFWERWIRTTYGIEVKDGERVVINDEDNRKYWDTTSAGGYIVPSRTSILETLPKIVSNPPKLTPKSTTGRIEEAFFRLRGASSSHPWLTLAFVFVGLVIGGLWGKGRIRRGKGFGGGGGGFFTLDGEKGAGAGGKAD
ncbi:MAG: hypothetical protein M1835_003657 [Candelina submexicana]|nr:MAG: hypothetical protein M1835_003657 [Candelina submexicana]